MTRQELCGKIDEAIASFDFRGNITHYEPYGNGHINDTFAVSTDAHVRYIVQRMNHDIFKNPAQLMENIAGVTRFLRRKILAAGGDANRETLNIISTKDGHDFFVDTIGSYWRAYEFIVGAHTYETVEEPRDFYCSGLGFGRFQNMLSDYPADTLHETVADFHNTPMRLLKLRAALLADTCGRAASVANEVAFVLAHEADTHILMDLLSAGKLPLRVTHNDTKLNNIMIDDATREAICVIDLDTVMPGLSVNDFGDSIRFGASTATEDEPDLSKVSVDLALFEEFTRGFLKGCDGSLTDIELDMLPMGAKLMTLECGIRFLTDYLEGDCYFKISSEGQNLNRAHTQFKLVSDMERHWDELCAIVGKYRA